MNEGTLEMYSVFIFRLLEDIQNFLKKSIEEKNKLSNKEKYKVELMSGSRPLSKNYMSFNQMTGNYLDILENRVDIAVNRYVRRYFQFKIHGCDVLLKLKLRGSTPQTEKMYKDIYDYNQIDIYVYNPTIYDFLNNRSKSSRWNTNLIPCFEKSKSPRGMEQSKKTEEVVNHLVNYLKMELKYFLRLYIIAEKLDKIAGSVAWQSHPKESQSEMSKHLRGLKRFERREQWNASVKKLEDAMGKMLKAPYGDIPISQLALRNDIAEEIHKMKLFEADVLYETVKKLIPMIEDKKGNVDFLGVKQITNKLVEDLRALVALDNELQKLIIHYSNLSSKNA